MARAGVGRYIYIYIYTYVYIYIHTVYIVLHHFWIIFDWIHGFFTSMLTCWRVNSPNISHIIICIHSIPKTYYLQIPMFRYVLFYFIALYYIAVYHFFVIWYMVSYLDIFYWNEMYICIFKYKIIPYHIYIPLYYVYYLLYEIMYTIGIYYIYIYL